MAATDGSETGITGPDGVLYNATPGELKAKAADIRNVQGIVAGELSGLKSYVEGMEAFWGGIASQTFQQLMQEWDVHAAHLQEALLGIAGGLQATADTYIESEQVNHTNLSNVHLPPARLS